MFLGEPIIKRASMLTIEVVTLPQLWDHHLVTGKEIQTFAVP
jgi:hypothetical protein